MEKLFKNEFWLRCDGREYQTGEIHQVLLGFDMSAQRWDWAKRLYLRQLLISRNR